MAAMTLASRIKDCTIVNVSIPEWGIEIPDDTQDQLFFDNIKWDYFRINIEELCNAANRSQSIRIILDDYLQRMDFLMRQQFYFGIFPQRSDLSHEITDNDLLINIRAAEILNGMPQYPLLPIAFYEDIVTRAGLKPVFTGQLNDSGICATTQTAISRSSIYQFSRCESRFRPDTIGKEHSNCC